MTRSNGDGESVLVVDDDEGIRTLCERLFAEFSALSVRTASDVASARLALEANDDVRCIVSDYNLPDVTGVEFVESLRASGDDRPFVLLTGEGDRDVVEDAFDAGADDYVRKGGERTTYRVLVRRVETLVERRLARRELERERERFQTIIEASTDLITILDETGTFRYASPAARQVFGYEPEELVGENAFENVHPDDREDLFEQYQALVGAPDGSVNALEYRYLTGDGEYRWFESAGENHLHSAVDGFVIDTRDVTERKRREQSLEALNDAMDDLIAAESEAAIESVLIETPERVTRTTNAAYYRWCDETGVLELRDHTWASNVLPAEIDGDSVVWEAFVDEATKHVDEADGRRSSLPVDARDGLALPIDRYGVLLCVSQDPFDRDDVSVAETFVAGCRTAMDRIEYVDVVERKERELSEKEDRLARATRINDVVRNVNQVLVRSADKSAVARSVCRELTATDFVEMAWFGVSTGGDVDVIDWSGGDDGFVEQVLAHANDDDRAPARRALDAHEPVHVERIYDDDRCEGIRRAALNRGYRGLVSVPLVHRGMVHGVLELYAKNPSAFSDEELAVFDQLGDTIGYACTAIDQREARAVDSTVRVTVSLSDVDDTLYRAASRVDSPVVVTDVVSKADQYLSYIETADVDALHDHLDDQRAVDAVDELPGDRLEVAAAEFPLLGPLGEHAGEFVRFEVGSDAASLVARFPASTDVRSFIDDLTLVADDAALTRREPVTDVATSFDDLDLERHLTDRQREVLEVAYNRGFFAWPRESTGDDVAGALDISAPTFHQHIRKAVNRIVELVLQRRSTTGTPSGHGE